MKRRIKVLFLLILISFIEIGYAQYKEGDWTQRDTWMQVSRIFDLADIKPGSIVADIGCHEGYLTVHMANTVGATGKVYAVDVRKDRLDELDMHLEKRKLTNVKTILGDYDNPKLPLNSLDVVVILDTYHEMNDYKKILKHVQKSLKSDGRIVVIEKFKTHMLNKSRDEQVDAHTLSMNHVKSELKETGFSISKEIEHFGDWKNEKDKKIWMLVGKI